MIPEVSQLNNTNNKHRDFKNVLLYVLFIQDTCNANKGNWHKALFAVFTRNLVATSVQITFHTVAYPVLPREGNLLF